MNLDVVLAGKAVVALLPKTKDVVGSISYSQVQTLIDCIDEGNKYIAKVLSHSKTSVQVQIVRK